MRLGSALNYFADQSTDRNNLKAGATFLNGRISLDEAIEMLKVGHDKHAALQEQYLSLRSEITRLHYDLTHSDEKCSKLQTTVRELNYELERKRTLLAEKELQLAASFRLPPPAQLQTKDMAGRTDGRTNDANIKFTAAPEIVVESDRNQPNPGAPQVAQTAEKQGVVGAVEMEYHRQVQELLEEVRRKQSKIRELEIKLDGRTVTQFIGGGSEWERKYIAQRAEAEQREAALQAQADGLLKICEERLTLLKLQEDQIKKQNSRMEDLRARIVSQADALRNAASNTEMLEKMLFEEKQMLEEAKKMRSIAEEQLIEAQKAHLFISEAKLSADQEKERYNLELSKARKEADELRRQLDELHDRHTDFLRKEEGTGAEADKWKSTASRLEGELMEARAELRTLKRAEHDKTLGLETALVEREQSIRAVQSEVDEGKRRMRQYEHTLEDLTQSLSEALHREESIRKHSENIGLQMQVRITELQSRVGALEEERNMKAMRSA